MRVKICGITRPEDAREAAHCGADFIGLIRAPSARRVTVATARQVIAALPEHVQPVLLFRDAPLDEVTAAVDATGGDWVQLHGREPVAYLAELAARRPALRLIRAWEVTAEQADDDLAAYLQQAGAVNLRIDVVILDAPKGGAHPGYERLARISRRCRQRPPEIWCAGGLTPKNVAAAIAQGRYDGVDVASGVESSPGIKDHAALRAFIETARQL